MTSNAHKTQFQSPFMREVANLLKMNKKSLTLPELSDQRIQQAAIQLIELEIVSKMVLPGAPKDYPNLSEEFLACVEKHQDCFEWVPVKPQMLAQYKEYDACPPELFPLAASAHLLRNGQTDVVLAGVVTTTADVVRAGLRIVGLRPGVKTVCGAFILHRDTSSDNASVERAANSQRDLEDQPQTTYIYSDAAVVIEPTPDQLLDIASETVQLWQQVLEPLTQQTAKVAFLSFSTKGSANHVMAERMATAAQRFKERMPHIASDGELQFDAAFSKNIGIRKGANSDVAGLANCMIFPDLQCGNIAYKITQRLGGYGAYGPFLLGLAKPLCDLSRGASVEDIVASALINLLRAR